MVMNIADREDEEGMKDNSILSLTLCCSQINCFEISDTTDNEFIKHRSTALVHFPKNERQISFFFPMFLP